MRPICLPAPGPGRQHRHSLGDASADPYTISIGEEIIVVQDDATEWPVTIGLPATSPPPASGPVAATAPTPSPRTPPVGRTASSPARIAGRQPRRERHRRRHHHVHLPVLRRNRGRELDHLLPPLASNDTDGPEQRRDGDRHLQRRRGDLADGRGRHRRRGVVTVVLDRLPSRRRPTRFIAGDLGDGSLVESRSTSWSWAVLPATMLNCIGDLTGDGSVAGGRRPAVAPGDQRRHADPMATAPSCGDVGLLSGWVSALTETPILGDIQQFIQPARLRLQAVHQAHRGMPPPVHRASLE